MKKIRRTNFAPNYYLPFLGAIPDSGLWNLLEGPSKHHSM